VRLVSWNVNGIRAAATKGLFEWLETAQPDALCLQETKADPAILPPSVLYPPGYQSYWATAEKKGYSGVVTYCRMESCAHRVGFGIERFDCEGRVVATDMGDFDLYNIYFPNGGRGDERHVYKLEFYAAFLDHVDEKIRSGRQVVFCGDVNTAHREIDLARPKENVKNSGFRPDERAWLDTWVEHGWVDTFRHCHPEARDIYSWWDQRTRARVNNVGWRIDYFWVHQSMLPRVKDAGISPEVLGSDHCPVWLELRD
jgi:exodeoxyribonuclease-3